MIKKSKAAGGKIKQSMQYGHVFALINFETKRMSLKKKNKILGKEPEVKFYNFEDIYSVEKANVDIWKGEADVKMLQAKQKMILHTKGKVF